MPTQPIYQTPNLQSISTSVSDLKTNLEFSINFISDETEYTFIP